MKIGIAVAKFNEEITSKMLECANQHAKSLNIEIVKIMEAKGVFDLPLIVKHLLKKDEVEGVVTIGAVIKGETDHDELIMESIAPKFLDLSLEFEKPVSLGILGPDINWEQAEKRIESYSKNAVEAVLKSKNEIRQD